MSRLVSVLYRVVYMTHFVLEGMTVMLEFLYSASANLMTFGTFYVSC